MQKSLTDGLSPNEEGITNKQRKLQQKKFNISCRVIMANEDQEWRKCLLQRLRERNRRDVVPFKEIIQQSKEL